MDATATVHPDYNLVEPCDACPHCGEQQPLDTPCRRGAAVSGDPNYNCPLP